MNNNTEKKKQQQQQESELVRWICWREKETLYTYFLLEGAFWSAIFLIKIDQWEKI